MLYARLRLLPTAGLGIGVLAVVVASTRSWLTDTLHSFAAIGWALLVIIIIIRLTALTLSGVAWRAILGDRVVSTTGLFIGLRLIREAINSMLPLAQIGGDIIGGRLLPYFGIPGTLAAASILVDLLLQTATQGSFAMIGLAALWQSGNGAPVLHRLGTAVLLIIPALGGFFVVQRFGLFLLITHGVRVSRRFWPDLSLSKKSEQTPLKLAGDLRSLYQDRSALAQAGMIHFIAWNFGTGEIWLALERMRCHPSWSEALVLESLGQAARSAGFVVPAALGIQEAGFVLLGALFSLTPAQAIALSLVKRLPDAAIGMPGLIAWQVLETNLAMQRLRQPRHQPD